MPITFAHPSAILPFARMRRESGWLGGLVAGSVAPDILQSLVGHLDRFPHSVPGLVLLDIPTALLLAWLAHLTIAKRLRRMPGMETIHPTTAFAWKWALLAALIGAASHLGLDLFTHSESPLAQTGILAIHVTDDASGPFTVSDVLWYAASILGTLAIAIWLAWRARQVPGGWRRFLSWRWAALGFAALLPFRPIVNAARYLYTPDLFEFLHRLGWTATLVRVCLFESFALGLAALYLLTLAPPIPPEPPAAPGP